MSRVIAITGASGTVGSHLCRHFQARGWEVRALVRSPADFKLPGIRAGRCVLPGEIDESVLAGADVVVHAAYATRETDVTRARQTNEDGTQALLVACRRAGISRLVYVSTVIAGPEAPSYYARSKHATEALFDAGRDLIIRSGLVLARDGHGLFQQLRDTARRAHVVPLFDGGRQPLQTIHVDDLSEAIRCGLERELVGVVHVAEPDPPTLGGFLRRMVAQMRVRCLFVPLPFRPMLAAVRLIEATGVPFPLRSETLLGLQALRKVPVEADLRRLGLTVRSAEQSLREVL